MRVALFCRAGQLLAIEEMSIDTGKSREVLIRTAAVGFMIRYQSIAYGWTLIRRDSGCRTICFLNETKNATRHRFQSH